MPDVGTTKDENDKKISSALRKLFSNLSNIIKIIGWLGAFSYK